MDFRDFRDFNKKLTLEIVKATRLTFNSIRKQFPNDHFYAFVLSTYDDITGVYVSINSIENHQKELKKRHLSEGSIVDAIEEEYIMWTSCEWGEFEFFGGHNFDGIPELLSGEYDSLPDGSDDEFENFTKIVHTAMIDALALLDAENLWGTGSEREEVTLFTTIYDSFDTEQTEDRSAKILNSESCYLRFQSRYFKHKQAEQLVIEHKSAVNANCASLTNEKQVEYWLKQIKCIDKNQDCDVVNAGFDYELPVEYLEKLGQAAVIPMLEMVRILLNNQHADIIVLRNRMIRLVTKVNSPNFNMYELLMDILVTSCAMNEKRELWDLTPEFTASCLQKLFNIHSAQIIMTKENNRLLNYKSFISEARKYTG